MCDIAAMGNELEVRQILKQQDLLITRRQALAAGVHPSVLHRRARPGGPWQKILPCVYLTVTGTPTRDQRDIAAVLYAGRGGTLTGPAALVRHGMRANAGVVDVLIPANRHRQSAGFVVVHRTTRLPPYVCYAGPVQYALAARAVAYAMRDLADVRALVAAAVQSRRCTVEQLLAELEEGSVRGSALFREALAEVAQGTRSGPEGELLALIRRGKLPEPLLNARLFVGEEMIARPDAWWPDHRVAVEVDSREWHLGPAGWEQTMRRHARMSVLGIQVLHFSPRQIRDEPEQVLATIRAALEIRSGRSQTAIRTLPAA
jgi:very-short-patch-repair endonuclease